MHVTRHLFAGLVRRSPLSRPVPTPLSSLAAVARPRRLQPHLRPQLPAWSQRRQYYAQFRKVAVTFPPNNPFPLTWIAVAVVNLGTLYACCSDLVSADPREALRQARASDAFGTRRVIDALETLRWYVSPGTNPGACCNLPDTAPLLVRGGVLDAVQSGLRSKSEDVRFTAASLLCALLTRSELQRRVARDDEMLGSLVAALQDSLDQVS